MDQKQRTCILVGGNSGIGRAVLNKLESEGWSILTLSRHPEDIPVLPNIQAEYWDVTDKFPEDINLPESIEGVVYTPGTITLKSFARMTDDDFSTDWKVNYMGAIHLIRRCITGLKKGQGSAVLFSSVAAGSGMAFHASIAGVKAAIEATARSLAAEYAGANVRFNVIAPSLTDTSLAGGLLKTEKQKDAALERHPLKGIGDPDEVAGWTVKLLDQDSRWITGQVIGIDGGLGSLRV